MAKRSSKRVTRQRLGSRDPYTAAPQSGYRTVRHEGARVCGAGGGSGPDVTLLIALPVFAGESLVSARLEGIATTKEPERNDIYNRWNLYGFFMPNALSGTAGGNIDATADLENTFEDIIAGSGSAVWGGEPNPGGDLSTWVSEGMFGRAEMLFARESYLKPQGVFYLPSDSILEIPLAPDAAGSYHTDSFTTSLRKRRYFKTTGWIGFGVARWNKDAQTDFGIAELGASITKDDLAAALISGLGSHSGDDAQTLKAVELIYGGDSYIEADRLKEADISASLFGTFTFATPYPSNRR